MKAFHFTSKKFAIVAASVGKAFPAISCCLHDSLPLPASSVQVSSAKKTCPRHTAEVRTLSVLVLRF
jgi:hypothetical protein